MILADENIDSAVIAALRAHGIEVLSIMETYRGALDEEVIALSKTPPRIILTEDKDFGEWVYAHDEKGISVILLRYQFKDIETVVGLLLTLIKERGEGLFGKFTTITAQKIRIRSLK